MLAYQYESIVKLTRGGESVHQYVILRHFHAESAYSLSVSSGYYEIFRGPLSRESPTVPMWFEQFIEYPELLRVAVKLSSGVMLDERDKEWLKEVSEVTGWDPDDVAEDLRSVSEEPSTRAERYWKLYEEYLEKARKHYRRGDFKQAGEKLYGAVLALIKYIAAVKGVAVVHWSRGKVEKFITSNVEPELRELLRDLLDKVQPLHEHFYEEHLDEQTFRERWSKVVELLERTRSVLTA
ncbi:MAG: PaREP1 family protein [Thermofilaceae archaeon]